MQVFVRNHRDETLDEMLRAEGRGGPSFHSHCAECKREEPLFRCAKQTCIGPGIYCEPCIVKLHRQLPTHMVEKWNGEFFVPMMQKNLNVEARIQLGHIPGTFCGRARPAHKDFVVIDVLGIRVVKLNFCGCDSTVEHRQQLMRAGLWPATSIDPQTCATFNAIKLFEVQNCLGKISAYDFVRSLEMLSNNDGLEDRRRAFRAIVRQYRMMEMFKRAGRGQANSGVGGTAQGELAEPNCRMCPVPDVNIPEGYDKIKWDEMEEDQRYKYFLELSQDANFKLINRNVSTEERDPIVDDGAGFFCNRAEYTEHIRKNVDEEEISNCSGFQAMFLANAKRIKGLRVTGIGGVTCARHNMWRPNGIGDLQAGERYCNMDFLFFSSILGFVLTYLVLSYDIACQFSKNIWTRMESLPEKFHLKIDRANVRWMVPNFHLPPHKTGCHSAFSFHWLWGAGRTHGETVEQNWEFLNGIAASTKLMGLGARATALEGLFSFHNWRRLVAHRRLLKQRMAEGIKDGKVHKEAFEAFHEGLAQLEEVDVESWRAWVDKWEKERHTENEKGSPYEMVEDGMTLKEIRIMLAAEEYLKTGDGTEVEREDTPSTFITMGMELEEMQRQLAVAIKANGPNPTPTQALEILKRRTAVRTRVQAFRKLQGSYMPRLRRYLSPSQKKVWDEDDQQPEATRLFMPSDISAASRKKACAPGLDGVEARLRTGEASDALGQLRQGLRTRTMTNRFKIRNWTGQRALTRGQGILRQINIRIHAAKLRYRHARQALLRLKGHGKWESQFRILEEDDVRALNDRSLREEEQAHDEFLGTLGMADGLAATGVVVMGEGHRTLSWIWYSASGTSEAGDKKLHEALRVEWCKAYSRANRWREELVLVEEEMRRMIEYGRFEERRWTARSTARTTMLGKPEVPVDPVVLEGARAYALEQADRERRTFKKLEADWAPIRAKAAAYLKGEDISSGPAVVVDIEGDELRWSEARMQAAEEGENDMYQ
ncbi:hypothetical protein C8F04DRAFT_976705 [Mycena alexandri]|uniref:CxC2-like cysteine cluster KDZ transposase-associated domain-containing protein n=1 Tax=Mycena alexandri TaxID=1745969 RepID=A0AAD6WN68_9AGAR|nr:hypothetical protein C8F04DRAFT_976705 [Mycena alexandri]